MGLDLDLGVIKPEVVLELNIDPNVVCVKDGYSFERGIYAVDTDSVDELIYLRKHHATLNWLEYRWPNLHDLDLLCLGHRDYVIHAIDQDIKKIRRKVKGISNHLEIEPDIADRIDPTYHRKVGREMVSDLTHFRSKLLQLEPMSLITCHYCN